MKKYLFKKVKHIFIPLAAQCVGTTAYTPDVTTGNEPSLISITKTSTFYDMNISSEVKTIL